MEAIAAGRAIGCLLTQGQPTVQSRSVRRQRRHDLGRLHIQEQYVTAPRPSTATRRLQGSIDGDDAAFCRITIRSRASCWKPPCTGRNDRPSLEFDGWAWI